MRIALALVAAAVVLQLAPDASAQELGFGKSGQISLNSTSASLAGTLGLDPVVLTPFIAFGRTSTTSDPIETPATSTEITQKRTTFLLNPGIDVFVIDHLSIGGEVLFATTSSKDESKTTNKANGAVTTVTDDGPSTTLFGIMPRIGYDIPLGASFSLWPRGGFGFVTASTDRPQGNGTTVESSEKFWALYADATFNWHPSEKFFIGIGPGFTHTLGRTSKTGDVSVDRPSVTTFRFLGFTIGGVLN